jgi:hypothetical protein
MSDQPDPPSTPVRRKFLNVGSGARGAPFLPPWLKTPDWEHVRLDIDPNMEPDILGSATDMHMVPTHSQDAVWAANIVEHLFAHEVPLALHEFARVIKPDGLVQIMVPDLQPVARLVADGKLEDTAYTAPAGPIAAIDMLFGHRGFIAQGRVHMQHKTGFITSTLARALMLAGFPHVAIYSLEWDLLALASTTTPLEQIYMPDFLRDLCAKGNALATGQSNA